MTSFSAAELAQCIVTLPNTSGTKRIVCVCRCANPATAAPKVRLILKSQVQHHHAENKGRDVRSRAFHAWYTVGFHAEGGRSEENGLVGSVMQMYVGMPLMPCERNSSS